MAISNYPPVSNGDMDRTIHVLPGSTNSKPTFTGVRKGIYKPIEIAAYHTLESTSSFSPVQKSTAYESELKGFVSGYMESGSGTPYYNVNNINISSDSQTEGSYSVSYSNKEPSQNIMVSTDNTTIKLSMKTYRTTVELHRFTMWEGSSQVNSYSLLRGNTMLTYIRSRSGGVYGFTTGHFTTIYRFGTNTTTFSTSIPSPTLVNLISGSGFTHGWIGEIVYEASETNKWVAVGAYAGSNTWTDTRPMIYSSTDAVTWTSRTTPGTYANSSENYYTGHRNVIYLSGSYYCSGNVGLTFSPSPITYAARIYTSTDGATWSQIYSEPSGGAGQIWDLCGNSSATDKFAMYSSASGYLYTSTDAITWTSRPSLAINGYYGLSAINGRYYVQYTDANNIYQMSTSTDGITWTLCTMKYGVGNFSFSKMKYEAGYYWRSDYNGVSVSTDGTTFEFYEADGYKDLYQSTENSIAYFPLGYESAHDGTSFGWIRTPQNRDISTPQNATLFYTTGSLSQYLYGVTDPEKQYMFALSQPSGYPTTA